MRIYCDLAFESCQVTLPQETWRPAYNTSLQLLEIGKQDGWPMYLFTCRSFRYIGSETGEYKSGLLISTRDRTVTLVAHIARMPEYLILEEEPLYIRLKRSRFIHEIRPLRQNSFDHETRYYKSFFLYNPAKFTTVQAITFPIVDDYYYRRRPPTRQSHIIHTESNIQVPISWPFSLEETLELRRKTFGSYHGKYSFYIIEEFFWRRTHIDVSDNDYLVIYANLADRNEYCLYIVDFAEQHLIGYSVDHLRPSNTNFLTSTKRVHETSIEYVIISEILADGYSGIDFTIIKVPRWSKNIPLMHE